MVTSRAFIIENPTVRIGPVNPPGTGTPLVATCDLTRAEITNNVNMVDTGTLCGPASQPGKIEFTLELDGYQGWQTDALARFLWENMRAQVPFVLVPENAAVSDTNPAFQGTCICVPPEVGGTRETAAVFTCALPVIGIPTTSITMPAAFMLPSDTQTAAVTESTRAPVSA